MNKYLAQFISILGHPLLIVSYGLLLLMLLNPYAFGAHDIGDKTAILAFIQVFATTFIIPGVGVAMMKPLGLISSLEMPDKQERTGPYIITGIFYLWMFKNFLSGGQMPLLFTRFVLGATIGLFLAFFINIFSKISAHAVGMGGLVALLVMANGEWGGGMASIPLLGGVLSLSLNAILAGVLLLAGLVGVARLALGAHVPEDLYRGFGVGVMAQLVAGLFV